MLFVDNFFSDSRQRAVPRQSAAGQAARSFAEVALACGKYHQLVGAGKPAKVAIAAIMRKLVVLANALIKANRTWEPRALSGDAGA